MAKPIEVTDWATSNAALKVATDSSRWNFGWQTLPDNLPTDIGEKPNLQQQNYWQNAVHTWLTYFDALVPDETGPGAVVDLWEWDTGAVKDGVVDPFCNTIIQTAGVLSWSFTTAAETGWTDLLPDNLTGARYQELLLYMTAGLSLQIVDAAGIIYTISPSGVGSVADAFSMSGTALNIGQNLFDIDPTDPSIVLTRDDSGTITNPADFAGFTTIPNAASFDSNNPDGLRIVAAGDLELSTTVDTAGSTVNTLAGLPVKRTWIRPLNNTSTNPANATITAAGQINFPMSFDAGGRYRVYNMINFDVAAVSDTVMPISSRFGFATPTLSQTFRDLGSRSFETQVSFGVIFGAPTGGISLQWGSGFIIDRNDAAGDGNMPGIYGAGNFVENWIIVEEDM